MTPNAHDPNAIARVEALLHARIYDGCVSVDAGDLRAALDGGAAWNRLGFPPAAVAAPPEHADPRLLAEADRYVAHHGMKSDMTGKAAGIIADLLQALRTTTPARIAPDLVERLRWAVGAVVPLGRGARLHALLDELQQALTGTDAPTPDSGAVRVEGVVGRVDGPDQGEVLIAISVADAERLRLHIADRVEVVRPVPATAKEGT